MKSKDLYYQQVSGRPTEALSDIATICSLFLDVNDMASRKKKSLMIL